MSVHEHSDRAYGWVGRLSERRAQLTPDRVGLVDAETGEEYTYAELDRRANRTARLLRAHGVGEDDRVAVVSRNRPELVDLYFATAKLGAVLAPLSHRLAPPELAALLADTEPAMLVVEEPFAGDIRTAVGEGPLGAELSTLLVSDDADPGGESGRDETDHDGQFEPYDASSHDGGQVEAVDRALSDPHLFLHTGGSTGLPKQVVQTHGGILWNAFNTILSWGLRPDDTTPMVFPLFHTGGWNVLTIPLFQLGGTVVLTREVDPGQVLELVESRSATVLVAVPAVLRFMVEHDDWAGTDLSSLRFVKSGGGPCRESIIDAWTDRGVSISQGYGLTECGPNNFAMPEGFPREKTDTIGVPGMYVDARVVDDDGAELPTGEVGELELASPHAGDRYWRAETETEETFGDWVSTGDLASVDDDGYVSIEGRKKNMFVSGGENVFPPEIEDAITDHPAITEAVVIPVPDEKWGQVGKAVVESDEQLTLPALQEFLDGRLARYKFPRALAVVDEIPTSGVSKIDRTAVAEQFGE
jgi:fatty-acyl-CoA synthase